MVLRSRTQCWEVKVEGWEATGKGRVTTSPISGSTCPSSHCHFFLNVLMSFWAPQTLRPLGLFSQRLTPRQWPGFELHCVPWQPSRPL